MKSLQFATDAHMRRRLRRTPQEVLHIVYLRDKKVSKAGLDPNGTNGSRKATAEARP
jgi:hypothetical protein